MMMKGKGFFESGYEAGGRELLNGSGRHKIR